MTEYIFASACMLAAIASLLYGRHALAIGISGAFIVIEVLEGIAAWLRSRP